jgi:hypothetical protein
MTTLLSLSEIIEAAEQSVDQSSLATFLENVVAHICHAKAEHLRTNWQDEAGAQAWEHDARKISALLTKLEN